MSKLPDRYNPQQTEKKQQNFWAEKQIYKWQNDLPKNQTFVIDTPPPTVSGLLHMGHIFSYTQADFIARFKRMKGFDVFYPMGFDDNGLPTERLVEKTIGKKANQMPREEFVNECQKVVDVAEVEFENLFNTVALSVDWSQKYQTISKESQKISQASFVDLFNKKLVERRFAPVLWDCVDRTALSQADLVDKEMPSAMHDIKFGVEGGGEIVIATTRPELLPACVAVMVHPDDSRYKNLHGKKAITALFGVKVPIIPDELVQMDKGSGAVMCCTFGDETDIKWWQKHELDLKIMIGEDGRIAYLEKSLKEIFEKDQNYIKATEEKHEKFFVPLIGKKIKEAREDVIANLISENLLLKSNPITHSVKCAERSGAPIEILTMPQWFVKILDKKEQLKAKANECKWYPDYMKIRVEQWIDNLAWDWCISRQRYFGVPFPVWHLEIKDEKEKQVRADSWYVGGKFDQQKANEKPIAPIIVAPLEQLPVDPLKDLPTGYFDTGKFKDGRKIVTDKDGIEWIVDAETDVMDTWATSSISPQLSSKGISKDFCIDKQRHEKLFPADMRPQAHEIIRTWAFYTIAKAMLHEDKIPWKNLMISGWCLAADKTKMSKSKGNVITPQSLIEEKGADVVRYWASASNLGADIAYSEELFKIGGKLITKLFNASKFVSQNFADLTHKPSTAKQDVASRIINEAADLWILSRLTQTINKAEKEFEEFEYAKARQAVEDFFWNDFCDNYLEIVKVRSYGLAADKYKQLDLTAEEKAKIAAGQQSGLITLYHCLEALLKLFAPFIPHVSEELYQAIFPNKLISIHQRGSWCKSEDYILDEDSIKVGELAKEVIFNIRKFKSDNNLSMKTPLEKFYINSKSDISAIILDLQNVCNAGKILVLEDSEKPLVFDIIPFLKADTYE
ncbi:MAG: valine--tRNA ligase [Rickettsiaceae bacterium]|jgi:valyl-tRNA synthetase|nr:valine--tRNA ligase [Rickettsiaceae bacterium]